MNWPNHTDYQDAIQNPGTCFAEEALKTATVTMDMLGMPRVMSGNFASVYELTDTSGKHYAIRCFVRQVVNTQVRYNLLAKHLQGVQMDSIVGFEFFLRGIRVRNEWYPVVRMDWVQGVPMHMYVDEHVNEPETMLRLAKQWRELVKQLKDNKIAHGDLQHGNVMCSPEGLFRLVDYDGMYVPAFGQARSPELGHANYQHPRRTPDYYELNLDNFAALVGYTSFLALAKEPDLWAKYHTGDNLILLSNDFKDPRNSPCFQRLKKSPDQEVQKLAAVIERASIWPIAQVPGFEETLTALANGTLPEPAPLPASANVVPDWLSSGAPDPAGTRAAPISTGTRAAPLSSGTRAAPLPSGTRAAPQAATSKAAATGSRAATQITPMGTRAADPAPAPQLAQAPQKTDEGNMNLFGWAALGMALLSLIPAAHLVGILAVLCGVIGMKKGDPSDQNGKMAAWGGIVFGGVMFMLGVFGLLTKKKQPEAGQPQSSIEQNIPFASNSSPLRLTGLPWA